MGKLTDRTVANATCPPGRKDVLLFDDGLKGFGVRITRGGGRVFLFQYNVPGGKRRVILGTFGTELTTTQARKKAETLRGKIRDGGDPIAERHAAKVATRVAEADAKAAAAAASYTVDRLIADWTALHLTERSAAYRLAVPRHLRTALREWLSVAAASLGRADAVHVLDSVKAERGPIAANRLHAEARAR
jgi:hypothetical protein